MQEPDPTPFDLNWRMFGVSVRVHPLFWVLAAFLGWPFAFSGRPGEPEPGLPYLLLFMGCVFVSVLLHEFGHVVAGRAFGAEGRILLYSFGGLAVGSSDVRDRWKRIIVYLAGPIAELLLVAVVFFAYRHFVDRFPVAWERGITKAAGFLIIINLFWGVFNLLPVYPLDGGQVTRELCEAVVPGRGAIFALGASTLVCCGIALLILLSALKKIPQIPFLGESIYNALLFGMFAANSFQAFQIEKARRSWDDRLPWER